MASLQFFFQCCLWVAVSTVCLRDGNTSVSATVRDNIPPVTWRFQHTRRGVHSCTFTALRPCYLAGRQTDRYRFLPECRQVINKCVQFTDVLSPGCYANTWHVYMKHSGGAQVVLIRKRISTFPSSTLWIPSSYALILVQILFSLD